MEVLLLRNKNINTKLAYLYYKRKNLWTSTGKRFNLDTLSEEECLKLFRFKKENIKQIRQLLKIPFKIKCANGVVCLGDEGFCMLLRRLVYPNRLFDLQLIFQREGSAISRIINLLLDHIYENFRYLLSCGNNKPWLSAEALMDYCSAVEANGAPLTNCWGFIDGTVRAMCRPSRHQRIVYNGHKRVHSLKYQSIMAPNGLIVDFYGPIEGRRHDAYLLSQSGILPILETKRSPDGTQPLCVYGDPAYPLRPQLMGPWKGAGLTEQQKVFNKRMSKVRISVEWGFEKVLTLFAFNDFKKNLKLFHQPLSKYFCVSVILTNCHTCLNGSKTSDYFGIDPPTLEEYLSDN